MKKTKMFMATLLAAALFTAISFASCKDESPTFDRSPETSELAPLPENNQQNDSSFEHSSSTENEPPNEEVQPPNDMPTTAQYIRCTGNSVNLRSGAGTEFAVLGRAEKNTSYAVVGKIGSWYQTYYRGKKAYISASYVSAFALEKSENADVEKVIDEGYKLIGTPYVYGAIRLHDGNGKLLSGFTTQKFDCSSLVQYVFYVGANTLLGVHTRAQFTQGTPVKKADLQRGDCIYFTNESRKYNTGIERIGHVAIYLGDGYILHTASDYARIEKMSATRWNYYVEARRFL